MTDRDLLLRMFEDNHYKVHDIVDAEDVLESVHDVMSQLDRSSIKLMHLAYTGNFAAFLYLLSHCIQDMGGSNTRQKFSHCRKQAAPSMARCSSGPRARKPW